ncbi:MAG: DUF4476 domain-containing protein [Flavobacteriales bacterium]
MKRTIFTFLMFIGIGAFAQGNLIFFTEDGELFYLSMNGVRVNTTPMSNVKIEGVKAPGGMATVTFSDPSLGVVKKNVPAMDGHEYTFKVKRNKKGEWKITYFTDVVMTSAAVSSASSTNTNSTDATLIQQKADPIVDQTAVNSTQNNTPVNNATTTTNVQGTTTNAGNTGGVSLNINMNGMGNGTSGQQTMTTTTDVQPANTTTSSTTTTTTTTTSSTAVNNTQNTSPNNTGISLNVNINGMGINTALNNTMTTTTTSSGSSSNIVINNEPDVLIYNSTQQQSATSTTLPSSTSTDLAVTSSDLGSGCGIAMDDVDFNDAKSSISSKPFEDSKMTVAKQITENNCLSTSQVKQIMGLFTYEETKLEFAKFAYSHTVDKNKYYKINDAFTYSTSIDELQEYIKANK